MSFNLARLLSRSALLAAAGLQVLAFAQSAGAAGATPTTSTPAAGTAPGSSSNPFGFTPPAPGAFVTQALVPWVNTRTGQRFVAPTGGWTPPDGDWQVEAIPSTPLRR